MAESLPPSSGFDRALPPSYGAGSTQLQPLQQPLMDAGSHADGAAPPPVTDRGVSTRPTEGFGARMARLKGQAKSKVLGTFGMVCFSTTSPQGVHLPPELSL